MEYTLAFVDTAMQLLDKQSLLQEDTLNQKVFRCIVGNCNKVFNSKRSLDNHKRQHSGRGVSMKYEIDGIKIYKCTVPGCNRSFISGSGLKKHMNSHSDNPPEYVCDLCKERKTFKTKEVGEWEWS